MSDLRTRVLQRFHARLATIPVGTTVENGTVRIHRYRTQIEIWDLTNAGKRGKRVERLSVTGTRWESDPTILYDVGDELESCTNFNQAKTIISNFLKKNPDSLDVQPYQERGVDVYPAGFKEISIKTPHVLVEVGYKDFTVKNLDDMANEPTCIPATKGGQRSIPVFYRWVQDNQSAIPRMTYHDVLEEMSKLGIPSHSFCAVD